MNATAVVQGLAMGQMFKVESMRFYNDYGRWPGSNRELNLKDGADYAKKAIKRVDIGEDGVITFTYNSKSGVDNGTVKWLPPVGGGSQWGCVTSSFPGIAQYIPQCRFEKPVALQE